MSFWRGLPLLILFNSLPVTAIWSPTSASDIPRRNVRVDDEFRVKTVSEPALSPDGRRAAYTVTTTSLQENTSQHRVWMVPTAGGASVPMSAAECSSWQPQFSRDGSKLYFLSSRVGETSQVWLLDLVHGGDAQQLTDLPRGTYTLCLSPDESRLALVIKDPVPDRSPSDGTAAESGSDPPWIVDRLQFKRDYAGYLDRRRSHIYVYDIATKRLSQVTSGDYDDSDPAWSPDGNTLAFVSNRTEEPDSNRNTDIWLVDADNTDQGKNLMRVTSNPGSDAAPVWHPDGTSLAYISVPDVAAGYFATSHLALQKPGGEPRLLTRELDRNVSDLTFSRDGQSIYFLLEDSGEDHVARWSMSDGSLIRPVAGPLSVSSYAVAPDGTLVAVIGKPDLPDELFAAVKSDLRQLTSVNADLLSELSIGPTEEIHFRGHDGWELEGFITKPASYNPNLRYPTVVLIHGGPVSQYNHAFHFEAHYLAAHDYIVVRCNPRGSSGYGQDFARAIYQGWGEKDYRDILSAVDRAVELGIADPDRLGVGGYSYGGFMTNYLITKTDRFRAAVSGAGSALHVANYGHDMYQHWYESELGLPWENRELWERLSPFNGMHQVTTPTLFACGEKDWNVPVQNSEQLYQVLRRRGISTRLVVYPGEHHGGWSCGHQKDFNERLLAWYDEYLKPDGDSAPP